jgi:hypothetical protein
MYVCGYLLVVALCVWKLFFTWYSSGELVTQRDFCCMIFARLQILSGVKVAPPIGIFIS